MNLHINETKYIATEGITHISELEFSGAKNLVYIELPETVEKIGNYAFLNCYSLTQVKLPSRVIYIGAGLFQNCWKLRSVSLPEGLKHIGNDMFESCHSLEKLVLPASLETVERTAFSGCRSLKEIYISPEKLEVLPSSARYTAAISYMENYRVIPNDKYTDEAIINNYVSSRQRAILDLAINRRNVNAIRYMLDHDLVDAETLQAYLTKSANTNRVEVTALLLEFSEKTRTGVADKFFDKVLNDDPFA